MTAERERYLALDALRGVAALVVLVYHFTLHSGVVKLFSSAPLAVDLFFCLSGFVIAHAYQERIRAGLSLRGFLRLRLVRLYPAYLAGFVLGVIALTLKWRQGETTFSGSDVITSAALNLFYLPFPGLHRIAVYSETIPSALFPVNDPAWSLFFEFVANIAFWFVLRHGLRLRLLLVFFFIAFFITTKIFGAQAGWGSENILGGLPRVLYSFFAGVMLYQFRAMLVRLPRVLLPLLLLVLTAALAVPEFPKHTYYWFGMTIIFVPILVALGARSPVAAGSLWHRFADYSGALSYPLYCVHFPLVLLMSSLFPAQPMLGMGIGITLSLGLAHFVLRWVEKPLGQRLAAWFPAKSS